MTGGTSMSTQSSFVWYELMTTNVASAKDFYSQVVGWTTQDMPMPGMTYTILQAGSAGVAGMMPMPENALAGGLRPLWIGYVYADDVDAASAKVTSRGGTVHRAPADIPGVGRFSVVTDPQGALFQLFKPTPTEQRTPADGPGHIGWRELHTTDWPRAFDFYHALCGWEKGDPVNMGPMGTYQLFTVGGAATGALFNSPAASNHPFWLYYFQVDDIDAAARRVAQSGGRVTHDVHQVPGGQWILQAADREGAAFALLGPRK
jgi:uncharacterized protein